MEILDGGIVCATERGCEQTGGVVVGVEGQLVTRAVEGALEVLHHAADGDVAGQLEVLAAVGLAPQRIGDQAVPVTHGGDDVGRTLRALAVEGVLTHDGPHLVVEDVPAIAELVGQIAVAVFGSVQGIFLRLFEQGLVVAVRHVDGGVGVLAGEGTAVVVLVVHVDADLLRVEQAVLEVGRIVFGHPAHEAAPAIGVRSLQLAVEETVGQGGDGVSIGGRIIISFFGVFDSLAAQAADEAARGHVAVLVELDVDAAAAGADGVIQALGHTHKSADVLRFRLLDGAPHVQTLDGGILDVAEQAAVVVVAGVGDVERDGVVVAVELAAELGVVALADAHHHFGVAAGVGLRERNVGHQAEVLAAVATVLAAMDAADQHFPLLVGINKVGVGRSAFVTGSEVGGSQADGDVGVGHVEHVVVCQGCERARRGNELIRLVVGHGLAVQGQAEYHPIAAAGVDLAAHLDAGVVADAVEIVGRDAAFSAVLLGAVGRHRHVLVGTDSTDLLALGAAEGPGVVAVDEGEVATVFAAGESPVVVALHVDRFRCEETVGEDGLVAVGHPADEAAPLIGKVSAQFSVEEAVGDLGGVAVAQLADQAA